MSPCDSCHAGCCRAFAVPVTGADILRIERELKLSFWEFACRWADPHGRIARNYAPHFHFSDEPQTPFVVCLTHAESHFLKGSTKCRFLMEGAPDSESPLGQARCGIYHQRPAACRAFPTKLNETGELAIIHAVPERGRGGVDPAYDLCPTEWKPQDVDPIQTLQDLVVAKYEMAFFTQISKIWNRAPRAWELFPEFLHTVYASRVIPQVSENEEETYPSSVKMPDAFSPSPGRRAA